jgi:hypothetical protein
MEDFLVAAVTKNTGRGTVANKNINIAKNGQATVLGYNNLVLGRPFCTQVPRAAQMTWILPSWIKGRTSWE